MEGAEWSVAIRRQQMRGEVANVHLAQSRSARQPCPAQGVHTMFKDLGCAAAALVSRARAAGAARQTVATPPAAKQRPSFVSRLSPLELAQTLMQ